ncbi:alpha/beta fold hydrolase [Sphingobacterium sp. BN32]|uniref:alpha/beta fold hydrolase n=1 Tax=Sphingobacterium sp. BN32 TaxID=3058432 RepID=UPI00265CC6B3|nr:alpha/beta hydrolase [Sphingobacterium sp. BN32]WKK59628.1 alpha/beta hydrolase [Sphingobacterium sp. BN32]
MRLQLISFFLLLTPSLFGQTPDSLLYEQYKKDRVRYAEFESKHRSFVKGKFTTLSFLHWGHASENTFIWLHGSFLDAYDFEPFANKLVELDYQVISVDHYGHGKTGFPDTDLSFEDFADDLSALLDSLSVEKAVIGGFSRGGYLATSFYSFYPNRVKALVLEEGGSAKFYGHFYKQNKQEQGKILSEFNVPEDVRELYFGETDTEFEQYKQLYEPGGAASQFQLLGLIKKKGAKYITYQGLDTYYQLKDSLQAAQALLVPERISRYGRSIVEQEPLEIYRKLTVPLLLLEATKQPDAFPQEEENELLLKRHPQWITHVKFPNASHNIHYESAEDFIAVLIPFLSVIINK